jgi:hypothetical protein
MAVVMAERHVISKTKVMLIYNSLLLEYWLRIAEELPSKTNYWRKDKCKDISDGRTRKKM